MLNLVFSVTVLDAMTDDEWQEADRTLRKWWNALRATQAPRVKDTTNGHPRKYLLDLLDAAQKPPA